MAFGVFVHRPDSIYEDNPAERYHFPINYLKRVEACVGDWIVYYEPTKVAGSRGYFAVAKVAQVIPDPRAAKMFFALIEPGTYLDFISPVPFRDGEDLVERGLLNEAGQLSGRAQAAVRWLSPDDFNRIIERGLGEEEMPAPAQQEATPLWQIQDEAAPFIFEQTRERVVPLSSRILRDRVFRKVVLRAYDERCAVTGLKLINGGGAAEVDAAHIRPVSADGPDIVSNGLALSRTAHWMFDRGLISLSDDLEILISRHSNDPEGVRDFINRSGYALAPERAHQRPHPQFLRWHRENCFKQ